MPPKGWRKNKQVLPVPVVPPDELAVKTDPAPVDKNFPSFDDVRATMMEDEYRRGKPGPHGRVVPPGLHDAL